MDEFFSNETVSLLGTSSEKSVTFPNPIQRIDFQAIGGNVDLLFESGGDAWTLVKDRFEWLKGRNLSNKTVYFKGSTGSTVQLRYTHGVNK